MTKPGQRHLVLAGAGHAQLAVLDDLIRHPWPYGPVTLVTPRTRTAYSGMVPGWMAGLYPDNAFLIDIAPLAARAGVRLMLDTVASLDADAHRVELASGASLDFDALSLATGGHMPDLPNDADDAPILPVRPMEDFAARWAELALARREQAGFHLAIIGGGAGGMELALAARAALPLARISLVARAGRIMTGHDRRVQSLSRHWLQAKAIDLVDGHFDAAVRRVSGLHQTADAIILATGSQPSPFLAKAGLALDPNGFAAIGPDLQSISHPGIFAAGDVSGRIDTVVAHAGVHAVHAGPVLARNLRHHMAGQRLDCYQPRRHSLYLMASGDGRALLSRGGLVGQGRWAWRLKDWIDRRFVAYYARLHRV